MNSRRLVPILTVLCTVTVLAQPRALPERWSEGRAAQWYAAQPWLVGSNYIPATAINELEMWQAETFDPATIERELGLAEGLGMTTMRVFLHDLLWQQDAAGYRSRIDQFLAIAARHRIKPLLVLFDSCLGSESAARSAAGAYTRRPQLRLAAESGRESPPGSCRAPAPAHVRDGRGRGLRQGSARARLGHLERARQHERQQLRQAGACQQGRPRAGPAAAGVRLGAGGGCRAAADVRRVEGRLVGGREAVAHGAHPAGTVRRDFVPQLR